VRLAQRGSAECGSRAVGNQVGLAVRVCYETRRFTFELVAKRGVSQVKLVAKRFTLVAKRFTLVAKRFTLVAKRGVSLCETRRFAKRGVLQILIFLLQNFALSRRFDQNVLICPFRSS